MENQGKSRVVFGYLLMIGCTVLVYLLIRSHGQTLTAPVSDLGRQAGRSGHGQVDALLHVLLALVVVIVMARAIGWLFSRFHQPPVIGEILAGILLGPSMLGRIAPEAAAFVLPKTVAPFLGILSQVGVILYMFLVGLELDPSLLRKRGHATVAISHASIILPFVLGALLALLLYPRLSTSDVSFTSFSLFLGVSMSVTAFPVLARILTDRRIHKTRMGVVALTCAAVDDVTAWCLLAFVVSVVQARASSALVTAGLTVGYLLFMVFAARPLLGRLARYYGSRGRRTQGVTALLFIALLLSSLATDIIGIHAVFGAFALGALIPHDSAMARDLTDRLEDLVVVLLLPAFFAFTGLRTEIGLVSGTEQWAICGLIVLVASVGKFGGSAVAARLTGLGWRDSSALGILMNTRGLMELIVLNIGLELGVISPTLFAMLVMMAVVTTIATTPILHLITRGAKAEMGLEAPPEEQAPEAHGAIDKKTKRGLLVALSQPTSMAPLVNLAISAAEPGEPPPHVLTLVRRPSGGVRTGLRELNEATLPQSSLLSMAMAHARSQHTRIDGQARWTDDPSEDILKMAKQLGAGWVLLGVHQPLWGSLFGIEDPRGGIVGAVLARAASQGLSVGVLVAGHHRPLARVTAIVDHTVDGRATLDLASRIAHRSACELRILLVPVEGAGIEPEAPLALLLKKAGRQAERWLHTDVLRDRTKLELNRQSAGDLVLIGASLATELGCLDDDKQSDLESEGLAVLLVQGAPSVDSDKAVPSSAQGPLAGSNLDSGSRAQV